MLAQVEKAPHRKQQVVIGNLVEMDETDILAFAQFGQGGQAEGDGEVQGAGVDYGHLVLIAGPDVVHHSVAFLFGEGLHEHPAAALQTDRQFRIDGIAEQDVPIVAGLLGRIPGRAEQMDHDVLAALEAFDHHGHGPGPVHRQLAISGNNVDIHERLLDASAGPANPWGGCRGNAFIGA